MSQIEAKRPSKWRSVSVGSKPASLEEKVRKPRSSFVDIVNRVISKQRKISSNYWIKFKFFLIVSQIEIKLRQLSLLQTLKHMKITSPCSFFQSFLSFLPQTVSNLHRYNCFDFEVLNLSRCRYTELFIKNVQSLTNPNKNICGGSTAATINMCNESIQVSIEAKLTVYHVFSYCYATQLKKTMFFYLE